MLKKEFPILEFDSNKKTYIEPSNIIEKKDVPESCVITFFREVIDKKCRAGLLEQIASFHTETVDLPLYRTKVDGKEVALIQGFLGSAGSAGQLEELIAMGCKKFIVCGGAGVLQKNIAVGHLILPYSAVRDEGVSYHYFEPSREIECDPVALEIVENELISNKIPYIKAKTWTTDGFFRETSDKIALRLSENCVTVEMETAAFFAVSKFRGVKLAQILYGGDDLSGIEWDKREWNSREKIRENLIDLSLKMVLNL